MVNWLFNSIVVVKYVAANSVRVCVCVCVVVYFHGSSPVGDFIPCWW